MVFDKIKHYVNENLVILSLSISLSSSCFKFTKKKKNFSHHSFQ